MSVPMKGGNKTVINMGNFGGDRVESIAVLHRECGSSGKINKLMFACCCGFDKSCILYIASTHFLCAFSSRRLLCPLLICGCAGLCNVCFIHI